MVGTENFNNNIDKYNQVIKELSIKYKVHFIDSKLIYGEFLDKGENYHIDDGMHLNEIGYQVLIEELSKLIK